MRRSIQFCEWKALWWDSRKGCRGSVLPHIGEGITAYSAEQADTERRRASHWMDKWVNVRKLAEAVLEKHLTDEEHVATGPLATLLNEAEKNDISSEDY
jgi:hypothetical protein